MIRDTKTYKPYPAYKDTGVVWLGEIPEHWEVKRADSIFRYEKIHAEPSRLSVDSVFHYSIPSIQETGDGVFESPSDIDSAKLRIFGERLLISKLNPRKGVVAVVNEKESPTVCSTEFVPLDVESGNIKWAYFLLVSELTRQRLAAVVRSATRSHQRTEVDDILKMWHVVPPLNEQHAIAAFLDCETAKIDALVAKKERLIELLQEKRTALITRIVTEGLDLAVRVKDSSVEWLGEIPEHWTIRPLKRVSSEITVGVVVNPSTYISDEGVPFIYGSDIREGSIAADTARKISKEHSEKLRKSRLRTGDLITVRVGAPGVTAIIPPELDGANCASVIITRGATSFDSGWLCHVMNSRVVRYQIELVQYGAAQEQFNVGHAVEFFVPEPPMDEQHMLATFLDRNAAKIDALIARVREAIDSLKELRTALISAAVTGKIDVRDAVDVNPSSAS